MARPAPHDNPLNSSSTGWVSRLNTNFEDCTDSPFPIGDYADTGTLTSSANPKLYKDCLALVGGVLYRSNGTSWILHRTPLTFISDLDTGTATVADIVTAYNGLLADAVAKGWMSV